MTGLPNGWHSTQQSIWEDDRSITLLYTVDGLEEIVRRIMGLGPHFIIKKPPGLAKKVKELAEEIVKH